MKLELKHLAGYLPYGLNLKDLVTENIFKLDIENLSSVMNDLDNLKTIKPILHPLSDLTKEIEVNGEKFVPLVRYVESTGEPCHDFDRDNLTDYENACLSMMMNYEMRHQQDLEFLLEHHFDIHGLIENGLAIDINTL